MFLTLALPDLKAWASAALVLVRAREWAARPVVASRQRSVTLADASEPGMVMLPLQEKGARRRGIQTTGREG